MEHTVQWAEDGPYAYIDDLTNATTRAFYRREDALAWLQAALPPEYDSSSGRRLP